MARVEEPKPERWQGVLCLLMTATGVMLLVIAMLSV
jgi:hypothetical protein